MRHLFRALSLSPGCSLHLPYLARSFTETAIGNTGLYSLSGQHHKDGLRRVRDTFRRARDDPDGPLDILLAHLRQAETPFEREEVARGGRAGRRTGEPAELRGGSEGRQAVY